MRNLNLRHWLVAMSLVLPSLVFAGDDAVITKAQTLVKAGDYKAAYQLLEPLETERSGNVQYDMLLGLSALESGDHARAIFAFERVLATEPNNLEARALIAKGYYQAGEAENAKAEFNNVLSQNPNPEITKLIENNMLAIDKATGQATTFAAYLDVGIGHDSNINSATSNSTINAVNLFAPVTTLTPVPLTPDSREQSSNFVNGAAGISVRVPVSKNVSAFGSLAGTSKINWSNEHFDTSSLDYSIGLNVKHNIDSFSLALQGGSFSVDADTFREAIGVSGQWQRNVDNQNQVSIFAQASSLQYPDSSVRDAKRYIIGTGWGHSFDGDKAKVVYASIYGGKENTDDSKFDYFSNDIYGVRAIGQMAINYKLVAFAGASYEYRKYDEEDPSFLITRQDDQYDFNIGLRYLPGHNFTIKPQLSYIDNRSNNNLFEFDRYILSVNVRKDFNW
jgi:tetratricopeptide (TPR) repeat protein